MTAHEYQLYGYEQEGENPQPTIFLGGSSALKGIVMLYIESDFKRASVWDVANAHFIGELVNHNGAWYVKLTSDMRGGFSETDHPYILDAGT